MNAVNAQWRLAARPVGLPKVRRMDTSLAPAPAVFRGENPGKLILQLDEVS